ncbi:MAG: hypothetical protein JXN61_05960 [Sedimentisphaerales bacterium]|nr:hypothetical protein [Sedimentisphaerales bacterium]
MKRRCRIAAKMLLSLRVLYRSSLYLFLLGLILLPAGPTLAALPDGWASMDIGDVGQAGSANLVVATWTVNGSGDGIWGEADGFHYCYSQISGDWMISARVISITGGTHEWAKAGVMIREGLAPDSNHAFMAMTNNTSTDHATSFQWRSADDGDNNKIDYVPEGYDLGDPVWVKIERTGDAMTGYASMDGETWTQVGSHTNVMAEDVYFGLTVTSHDNAQLMTGTFDSVEIPIPGPYCTAAYLPNPPRDSFVGAEYSGDNVYMVLDFRPGPNAEWSKAYFSDEKADVDNRDEAHSLGTVPPWPHVDENAFVVGYDDPAIPEYARAPLVFEKTYYWCIDSWEVYEYCPGPTWSFTPIPDYAWRPNPANGEEWVWYMGTMTWNRGGLDTTGYKLSYDIYIGEDQNAVANATTASPEYMANVSTESYEYNIFPFGQLFWRVDTKLTRYAMPPSTKYTKGDVWSFTVAEPSGSHITDLNGDGITDFNDYAVFANDWSRSEPNLPGDINGNNKVNYNDLKILAWNWLLPYGNMNLVIVDGIRYETETDKPVYTPDENVEMFYRVTNLREAAANVGMVLNCEEAWSHFVVRDNGSFDVWEFWRVIPPCGYRMLHLEPHESEECRRTWSMVNDNGTLSPDDDFPVGPGIYSITAELELSSLSGRVPVSVSIEITAPGE